MNQTRRYCWKVRAKRPTGPNSKWIFLNKNTKFKILNHCKLIHFVELECCGWDVKINFVFFSPFFPLCFKIFRFFFFVLAFSRRQKEIVNENRINWVRHLPIHLQWRIFRDHSGPDGSYSSSSSPYSVPISRILKSECSLIWVLWSYSLLSSFCFLFALLWIFASGFAIFALLLDIAMTVAVPMASWSSGLHSNCSSWSLKSSETRFGSGVGSGVLTRTSLALHAKCFCLLQRGRYKFRLFDLALLNYKGLIYNSLTLKIFRLLINAWTSHSWYGSLEL